MTTSNFIFYSLFFFLFISCNVSENYTKRCCSSDSSLNFDSLGGVMNQNRVCPKTVTDIIVGNNKLDPTLLQNQPEMTINGINKFIKKKNITSIHQLVNTFPVYYKTNFSLVEFTKGEGRASLQFPRIVLFGSDGHFLMNISTDVNDPTYNLLDCAELDENSGRWIFSQFDFTHDQPILNENPHSCIRCHGENFRPIWGTNMNWPGVFGDNEAAGPNGEALSFRHANRMNEIIAGKCGNERFDFLKWEDEKLVSGGVRKIANNVFGAELLVSNMQMGTATAKGIFIRLKNHRPVLFKKTRELILLLGYEYMYNGILSFEEKRRLVNKFNLNKWQPLETIFMRLGVNMNESFSLSTLIKDNPKLNWSLGAGTIEELVFLQVLNDLMNDKLEVKDILTRTKNTPGIFECNGLGENIYQVVNYKMLHMFCLKGKLRYEVNKIYYPQDVENIKSKIFEPIYKTFIDYLKDAVFLDV
ncbi:hypothetical protein [Aquimarina agarilytica]|uniref:hypothetical protein n=1 Tax=Aquimarina agarilytica TaxID=1087449 RepID=UPI0002894660|nr:hypothetical protein [Aquimarina agarilytica]